MARSSRIFWMASELQAFLGWVPGMKYSVRVGQPEQASSPVIVQILTRRRSEGGLKPVAGYFLRRWSTMWRQMGEAPVIPEAT